MEVNNVSLDRVAVSPDNYPSDNLPEVAFVGKSNVGKSSLLNCMISRKALARTSQTPGKTRTINFYKVENLLNFVDLPGYGYAKLSKSESIKWGKMIEDYLIKRQELKLIVLLVDIRHEPSKNDLMMYDFLRHYNYKMIVVATKMDKLKRSQVQKHLAVIRRALGMDSTQKILGFSSETKDGRTELWDFINSVVATEPLNE